MNQKLKTGDRVAFSRTFLQSIGEYTGRIPFARGKVTSVQEIYSLTLVFVEWDDSADKELPSKANAANLVRISPTQGIVEAV